MAAINHLQEGAILNSGTVKYKIIGVLGQGGFGITYLVMGELKVDNVTTEAKFAIKEHFPSAFCTRENGHVTPKPDKQQEYKHSKLDFVAEAKKLHSLGAQNSNIVKVNEVFETNGTAYYVMQYINGESLSSYVKSKGKLNYQETLTLLTPIFDAVDFLHKSRINHLDIKPDNIMLHDGINGIVPVLIDFGLSVHFKKNGDKTSPKGVQGVSEGYSPLEQYAGIKEFIPATDIYALMATLLYCLTGDKPKSAAELKLPEIRFSIAKIVPQDSIDGICKALNKSYENRTSSISLLKTDLGLSSSSGTITDVLDPNKGRNKRIRLFVFLIAAVLVVILLCISWFKRPLVHPDNPSVSDSISDTTIDETIDSAVVDPVPDPNSRINSETTVPPEPSPTPQPVKLEPVRPVVSSGTLSLGYGTWTGGIKNGKPDGNGKIVFNSTHKVDRSTSYKANPGDYFIATYESGHLISGRLYDSSGKLLKTIIP